MKAYNQTNKEKEGYYLSVDISKYFASIDHDILKTKLKKIMKDKDLYKISQNIINSYSTVEKEGVGLALGNQTSQNFALYYLDNIDRIIKEKYK